MANSPHGNHCGKTESRAVVTKAGDSLCRESAGNPLRPDIIEV